MIEGYWNIVPEVKNVSFPYKGKRMRVDFKDGRVVIMPISAFPSVQAVPEEERGDWYIYGNGFTWDSCPDVIHVEQILGDYNKYGHEMN